MMLPGVNRDVTPVSSPFFSAFEDSFVGQQVHANDG
jgi:hypothetical protein